MCGQEYESTGAAISAFPRTECRDGAIRTTARSMSRPTGCFDAGISLEVTRERLKLQKSGSIDVPGPHIRMDGLTDGARQISPRSKASHSSLSTVL